MDPIGFYFGAILTVPFVQQTLHKIENKTNIMQIFTTDYHT